MQEPTGGVLTELRVPVERLRRRLDPAMLPFETTADVEPIAGTVGQPRALEALEFGLEVPTYGYNVYVAGRPGSGRESTVLRLVEQIAATRPTPPDWVYVHNFQDPERPVAISLPAGRGAQLARDMDEFLRAAQQAIPRAFESEEYDRRRRAIVERLNQERERLWEGVQHFAQQLGFAVELTPAGVISVPVVQGRPLAPEEYERLPEPVRAELERRNHQIHDRVADALREVRRLERETAERLRQLDREVALFAVGGLFEELRERYHDLPQVLQFLEQVREDIPEHLHDFFPPQLPGVPAPIAQLQALQQQEHLARYRVNVFVDNSQTRGAPVIFERNPSYYNLVGRIDYRATFGAMVTDFSQIRAGALHRANGGYLVLHTVELLSNPFAWDALKRALITGRVVIENLGQQYAVLPSAALRPDPIPLDVKVVLLGSPLLYYLLSAYDDDFRELFRVRADFAPDMDWSDQHVMGYAAFISRVVREQGLRHFDRSAVARVIEYGARQVEHQRKLSSQLLEIGNLVAEASYWAGKAGRDIVTAEDVETAIRKKRYRSDLIAERVRELIVEGTLKILTRGERVGQINGLAVIELGDFAFGKPSRVTARVSLGRGNLVSIEREIALSGPIHSKGFLILSNYLAGAYAQDFPLAISASITFEQAYEEIEGDSASSTELYALLSALSGLPIKQGIAVTGSVNQYGEIQAIGGVNEKIEGFFAVCKEQGLTGEQGVIIPAANVQHLMLDEEVIQAVAEGRFHIWAVETVDQGIEILTGVPAGERQPDGTYPEGTVHRRVMDRLRDYAERMRDFGRREEREEQRGQAQAADPEPEQHEDQDG
ncbi:AAA family ATPase [Thermomicrobium sp. CFH 73360]|uniref:Lon protease family protein n=1 Tax=Thermomicrobium sp. CFH 73360 TaxID=2951987 RepID=UPI00207791DF|nr:ATP-binding protein [Thermomicrobium sp. CFH 73360]MCM8746864.1 AAA family ATPase [Thermomicrobium sp. CFH 73360]